MQINVLQVLWIGDANFLPDKTQYLSLICPVLEAKFIFSKLDSLIESMQRIICQNLINPLKNANLIMIILTNSPIGWSLYNVSVSLQQWVIWGNVTYHATVIFIIIENNELSLKWTMYLVFHWKGT